MNFNSIEEAITEIQQPRSRFQLEHFVIGQHDTPEMQFYQLMLELQDTKYKIEVTKLGIRKTELEIKRLKKTGDEMDVLEAQEKELGLSQTNTVLKGAERELAVLTDFYNSCKHFTRDEIELSQPEYWHKRLTRQTNLQIMAGNVQWAQLDSLRQAGFLDHMIEEHNNNGALTNGQTGEVL